VEPLGSEVEIRVAVGISVESAGSQRARKPSGLDRLRIGTDLERR
jgi:hypothetical protein